jgi:ABC-type sulfate transport system permease component
MLALVSAISSMLSCLLVPLLLVVPLGVLVLRLSASDMKQMDAGLMDPDGYISTRSARDCAMAALIVAAILGGLTVFLVLSWVAPVYLQMWLR